MSLFNLSNLVGDTRFNIVNGGIPSNIGNLSKLMLLNLGENNLQGLFYLSKSGNYGAVNDGNVSIQYWPTSFKSVSRVCRTSIGRY
ncbi:hypothetical protein WN944_007053 [Citrus x changshan-huyou]|uniref:Uncharacterized protein n=1 Tax=Citrus x changshan-huyou TaxID=2935761 RepID=A0AAP0MRN0_9ROSI